MRRATTMLVGRARMTPVNTRPDLVLTFPAKNTASVPLAKLSMSVE